ncbi:MAG: type II toxin-antitoxin system HicB family antitoxin [Terriglobia bacterium]
MSIIFEVTQESDGGFVAECLTEGIFTQADNWEELRRNAKEAVAAYFFDDQQPVEIRLHLVRDEVLTAS